jgi:hypothetical protein
VCSISGLKGCLSETAWAHKLQSQGELSQQAWKGARGSCSSQSAEPSMNLLVGLKRVLKHSSNTLSADPRAGLISRLEKVPGTIATHSLQNQGWALSAELERVSGSNSPPAELRVGLVGRLETAATHILQREVWAQSAGLKGCQAQLQLTSCKTRVGLISGLERVPETAATHPLHCRAKGELCQWA